MFTMRSAHFPSSFTQSLNGRVRIQICHLAVSSVHVLWYHTVSYFGHIVLHPACSMTLDKLSCTFPSYVDTENLVAKLVILVSRGYNLPWQVGLAKILWNPGLRAEYKKVASEGNQRSSSSSGFERIGWSKVKKDV